MPTMTLVEFKKRCREQLIAGIVEDIYNTNPMWAFMPWSSYAGSGILVNREKTIGNSQFLEIGGTITAKSPSAVDRVAFQATTCIGDAEINMLEVAQSGSDINDVVSMEISSKAKGIGNALQEGMATGNGTAANMNSIHSMIDSSQVVTGGALTFEMLDELIQKVTSKGGVVDFLMATPREIRKIRTLYRALGGVPMLEVKMGNRSINVLEFDGIPVFSNSFLSVTETSGGAALTGGALSSIYAGNFDDGTRKTGISMIYPEASTSGISVEPIGAMETKDEKIFRVKAYTNLAVFNRRGLARLTDIPA